MKRLIIADVKSNNNNGKCSGHYFAVAHNYLKLYGDCSEVKVAGGPIFKTAFNESQMFPLPHDSIVGTNQIINKLRTLKNCRFLFRNTTKEDVIVFQHSGASTTFMGIALFGSKKNNIYVIQYDTDAISSPLKRVIYRFAKPKIKGFICPSQRIALSYGINGCIVTDYIYSKNTINEGMQYDDRVYDIAIVGSISPDKGVVESVKALSTTNLRVLVAGQADSQQSEALVKISNSAHNITLALGFVGNEEYYGYIRQAKYCMLNYHGVYEDRSSGVVLDILFNGTPILGHRCKALQFVEDENVGLLFDDVESFDFSVLYDKDIYRSLQVGICSYLDKQRVYKQDVINYLRLI